MRLGKFARWRAFMKKYFEQAFREFQKTLGLLCPYQGDNGFAERNLTHYLSMTLLAANPGSRVLFEIPVKTNRSRSVGHIDGLVISTERLIFIEAKQLEGKSSFDGVNEDLARFEEIASEPARFLSQFSVHQIGSRRFAYVVVADYWAKHSPKLLVPKWWESPDPRLLPWPSAPRLR